MLPRSLFLLGLSAALGLATPTLAETAKPQKPTVIAARTKASAEQKPAGQKRLAARATRKKTGGAVAELTPAEKAKAQEAAAEKARQAKLLALRAKAKADADARRAAALAPRQGRTVEAANAAGGAKRLNRPVQLVSAEGTARQGVGGGRIVPVTGLTSQRVAAQRAAAVGADVGRSQGQQWRVAQRRRRQSEFGLFPGPVRR